MEGRREGRKEKSFQRCLAAAGLLFDATLCWLVVAALALSGSARVGRPSARCFALLLVFVYLCIGDDTLEIVPPSSPVLCVCVCTGLSCR